MDSIEMTCLFRGLTKFSDLMFHVVAPIFFEFFVMRFAPFASITSAHRKKSALSVSHHYFLSTIRDVEMSSGPDDSKIQLLLMHNLKEAL